MQATKLPKNIVRYVEHNLYYYHEYLRDIERLRKDILYGRDNNDENVGGGRSNLPSSPTERAAIELVTHRRLEKLERVTHAIKTVYEALPDEKRKLIKLKYWTRPQRYTWDGIAEQLHITKRQAMRWRSEVIYAIAELLGEADA
ncbi:RinA transcriptional activator-like protein [Deep-sea thermophilic phage D6E]|uniref:transcriptional regulator n=1 Tax=Deep-sea thermophilic phage D6E TaxID=749413 RepID=UPI0001F3887B|nr:transcriptional regulator [Deep-sea thermophilic phage D6E]ADE87535.1 RinA transcriptional activator-like protein [Deep-sea thermophilic phage D6E]